MLRELPDSMFSFAQKTLRKHFSKLLKKIKIKGTLYMLRYTYATNLQILGASEKELQVYMGHYSSVLTNDIYTTYSPDVSEEDIRKIYKNLYPYF